MKNLHPKGQYDRSKSIEELPDQMLRTLWRSNGRPYTKKVEELVTRPLKNYNPKVEDTGNEKLKN